MKTQISHLAAGVCLLLASSLTSQAQAVFESDFAPGEATYDPSVAAPGWAKTSATRWAFDAGRAPTGNGYFGEALREAGGTEEAAWETSLISIPGGTDYTVNFDFKATSDATVNGGATTGRVDFRVRTWGNEQFGETSLELYNTAGTAGDAGLSPENGFASLSVSDIGNGWRTVTLTGTTPEFGEESLLWFVGWNWAGNENHFTGSFGVDNVSIIPEPGTYALWGGLIALGVCLWRRKAGKRA